jgi:hypothetical protein
MSDQKPLRQEDYTAMAEELKRSREKWVCEQLRKKWASKKRQKSRSTIGITLIAASIASVALFFVAFGITMLCYLADGNKINYAKCCLCGAGWMLVPQIITGLGLYMWVVVVAVESDKEKEAQ